MKIAEQSKRKREKRIHGIVPAESALGENICLNVLC